MDMLESSYFAAGQEEILTHQPVNFTITPVASPLNSLVVPWVGGSRLSLCQERIVAAANYLVVSAIYLW
jgi:hypothetical protein